MISILPYDLVKTSVAFLEIPPCAPAAMSQSMALYFCPEIRMPQILGNPQNGLLIREHPIKMDDEDVALFQEAPILQHQDPHDFGSSKSNPARSQLMGMLHCYTCK